MNIIFFILELLLLALSHAEEPEFTKSDCLDGTIADSRQCLALSYAWNWDDSEKKCSLMGYGGCNPSRNNFRSEEECLAVAGPVCG